MVTFWTYADESGTTLILKGQSTRPQVKSF